ncbi:MAG TPA: hypothetical protein VMU94_07665 [Streptosporangiaceae bacterium]|nr:hypothetical protein [Streptosporangiaceae bacterium]
MLVVAWPVEHGNAYVARGERARAAGQRRRCHSPADEQNAGDERTDHYPARPTPAKTHSGKVATHASAGARGCQPSPRDGSGLRHSQWDELDIVDHLRRYLTSPHSYLRHFITEN